jgi:polyisoprenoid-binding protein YceI
MCVSCVGEHSRHSLGHLRDHIQVIVTIDFEYTGTAVDPYGNHRIGLDGKTTVNRKDWGVNWNAALEAGGVLVSEKVTLEFEVSAIRAVAP